MSTSSSSCRLPDELVFMVIARCDHLDDKRNGTLAALCRLSQRFTPAAERLLYADLVLESYPGEPVNTDSALYALIKHPRLRRLVRKVDLYVENESLDDMSDDIIHVLCGMPNIQDLLTAAVPAARLVLANPDCRLLSFNPVRWDNDAASLMVDRPTAFAVLQHVGVKFEDVPAIPPPVLPALSSLLVSGGHGLPAFALFTAPLAGVRVDESDSTAGAEASFELPASSNDILLALPPHLRHLSLVTNAIRPVDLATYLIGPLRPIGLRILSLGHALGSGFRAILDDADGVHGALAGELERAGIEVTTTAADP
ncbi:hypothetical protein JCM3775_003833 [Rhodotorula graminis]